MLVACIAIMLPNLGKAATTANLLVNPGFEEPAAGGYIHGWPTFGDPTAENSTLNYSSLSSYEGSNQIVMSFDTSPAGSLAGFYQDVVVSAGTEYTFSGQVDTHGDSFIFGQELLAIIKIEWIDAGQNDLGSTEILPNYDPEPIFRTFSITDIAPAGTVTARVTALVMTQIPILTPTLNLARFDDFRFSETPTVPTVPEPSSTALLGLGGLALMLRRRR